MDDLPYEKQLPILIAICIFGTCMCVALPKVCRPCIRVKFDDLKAKFRWSKEVNLDPNEQVSKKSESGPKPQTEFQEIVIH